jgi:hypothetical protein
MMGWHICHFVEVDNTEGVCHLVGEHGGRCSWCGGQAGDGPHLIERTRLLCPYPTCRAHHVRDQPALPHTTPL